MPDVNVLVYAHRQDEANHSAYARWLKSTIDGSEPFALSVLIAVGFVRIVTNTRIYAQATPLQLALAFVEQLTTHPRCRIVTPSMNHLDEVARLCRGSSAAGKHVADAQHAALAIQEGCTFVTRDGDFARFASLGLRWQHLVLEN